MVIQDNFKRRIAQTLHPHPHRSIPTHLDAQYATESIGQYLAKWATFHNN